MWKKPWQLKTFDNLYNRDERFFSIIIKGALAWLNKNVVMYDSPIQHFILSTGSSYMYVENNGYEFSFNETSGEDYIYMQMPRCIVEMADIAFDPGSLTNNFARGEYERYDSETNEISGYNAEIYRIPIELSLHLRYVLSNFNEAIILVQEIIDKLIYQHFFSVVYLGQIIKCGIEFPSSVNPQLNKIDFSSNETNQKIIEIDLKITTNYPSINDRTEIPNTRIIANPMMKVSVSEKELENNNR